MRKLNLLLIAMVVMSMSSCALIGGIFKAGAIVGILAVFIVIAIIIWIISLFRGRS
ncbi:phosphatidate cytidylyltransferase [Mucilaginibacter sp. L196]|uniref:phosphatidate cytidylyltransferase n=1 Tax=Mucilaginibacter sp. L196 TaxID=1641870 RepID=UPI00131E115A|nr:phosphatidate cytidylyltransferase [Mucilaginibacter sp. L196]